MNSEKWKELVLSAVSWGKEHLKIVVIVGLILSAGGIFFLVNAASAKPAKTEAITLVSSAAQTKKSVSADKTTSSADSSTKVTVDLKGAVKKPSIYTVSSNLRVNDIIALAGGFAANADQKSVNLAAKIKDEEVIYVSTVGENAAPAGETTAASADSTVPSTSSATDKVNINTADLTTLETLSGIGAKKAQDIIDYRTKNGLFKSVDDLGKVAGFGDKTLAKLKDAITID